MLTGSVTKLRDATERMVHRARQYSADMVHIGKELRYFCYHFKCHPETGDFGYSIKQAKGKNSHPTTLQPPQCCPQATAHSDFSSYSCFMRRLLFQDFLYSAISSIVNVVIFAAYSSQCAVYFEMCGQHCPPPRPPVFLFQNSAILSPAHICLN